MPRTRLPTVAAKVTGADIRNPSRFAGRNDPTVMPIGEPPRHLTPRQKEAWRKFVGELPWLKASDAALLELASDLRASVGRTGGMKTLQIYSAVLSKLGATPTDRSKVPTASEPDSGGEFFDD